MILLGAVAPVSAYADSCSSTAFFGLDPWYATLECDGKDISQSNFQSENLSNTVLGIIATVVKDLLFVAGFLAVGLIMYGGFLMVTSAGNPSAVEKAKRTISGSITGLIIAVLAYAIATFVLKVAMGN